MAGHEHEEFSERGEGVLRVQPGKGREALQLMIAPLYDDSVFSAIGLHDQSRLPAGVRLQTLAADPDNEHIAGDTILVKQLSCFVQQLLKARLRSLSWSERGWPGRLALAFGSEDDRSKLLAGVVVGCHQLYQAWSEEDRRPVSHETLGGSEG